MTETAVKIPPTLHRKLSEAMAAIDWQPKTGRNQQQNYNFVSVERIKDAVRTELAQRGVMVYTSIKAIDRSEFTTKSLTTMFHIFVQGEVTFADADSGEMFTVEAAGEAMDAGDKALNKAQTALVKYALINTFLIPTGDDPDQETQEPQKLQRQPRQAKPEFAPLDGPDVPADGEREHKRPATAGMVQCDSRSPFAEEGMEPPQCRREQGHPGAHRTENESWS